MSPQKKDSQKVTLADLDKTFALALEQANALGLTLHDRDKLRRAIGDAWGAASIAVQEASS